LASEGFLVYVVELRGSGLSRRNSCLETGRKERREASGEVGFDAHLDQDLPAILNKIQAEHGGKRVQWVGHSMGGMLAYAMSGTPQEERLSRLVAVASPVHFRSHNHRLMRLPAQMIRYFPRGLRLQPILRMIAPLAGVFGAWPATVAVNAKNMEGAAIRRVVFNLLGDLSRGHLLAIARFISNEKLCGPLGEDYTERMAKGKVPALLISGAVDGLAPPNSVEAAATLMGSRARYRCAGTADGFRVDYGHGDILLGKTAVEEIFPIIADFLREGDPVDGQAAYASGGGR